VHIRFISGFIRKHQTEAVNLQTIPKSIKLQEPTVSPSTLPGTVGLIVDLNHDNAINMTKAVNEGIMAVIHKASESASLKILPTSNAALRHLMPGCFGEPTISPVLGSR